jgi:hypothetical protein
MMIAEPLANAFDPKEVRSNIIAVTLGVMIPRPNPRRWDVRHDIIGLSFRKMALRRAQYAEIREIDRTIQLDSLAILEEVLRHFYWKARILEGMGTEGDYDAVDRAWAETG